MNQQDYHDAEDSMREFHKDMSDPRCLKASPSSAGYPKKGDEFVGFGFIGVVDRVSDETVHYYMRPMGKGSMSLAAYANTAKKIRDNDQS